MVSECILNSHEGPATELQCSTLGIRDAVIQRTWKSTAYSNGALDMRANSRGQREQIGYLTQRALYTGQLNNGPQSLPRPVI